MSDFKVGDIAWFIGADFKIPVPLKPNNLHITHAIIKEVPTDKHLYEKLYQSKQDCIDAFKRRLDEL